ncbi:hemin uptake protein HemP [Pseudoxanthomonas sp. GW2]|uniref:hemin uptake protein HemP n=1 Tax=Pseudoxanthomonas sp. GW2 TaxID=1211114 RepID=UPI0002F7D274|nr:hemin uptake protein HemP [Pseudoxanthomonas sp. GW2]
MNVHRLSLPSSSVRSTPDGASVSIDAEALSSEQLLRGRREILIRHGDRVYRLRHTSNDKLILTK